MDIKLVIKALQLNDEEWEEHLDLINRLRVLTDAEQAQLFSALEPQKKSTKKPAGKGGGGKSAVCEHCRNTRDFYAHHRDQADSEAYHQFKPASKSARGESLKGQLNKQLGRRRQEQDGDKCAYQHESGAICFEREASAVHHDTVYTTYHEYQPPATHAGKSNAQSAAGGS